MKLHRQIRKLEKALGYLKSDRSSAAPNGCNEKDWFTVSKNNAITILEEMVEDLRDEEEEAEHAEPIEEPKKKTGRYMGVAGSYD